MKDITKNILLNMAIQNTEKEYQNDIENIGQEIDTFIFTVKKRYTIYKQIHKEEEDNESNQVHKQE